MLIPVIVRAIVIVQLLLAARFFRVMWRARNRKQIGTAPGCRPTATVSAIVPVLNEAKRIEPCLEGLSQQGELLTEIIVVDGGSSDGTPDLVERWASTDSRIRLVQADERPTGWNGKSWGLQVGFDAVAGDSSWVLTVDADVRCRQDAVRRVVRFAESEQVPVLSLATRQVAHTLGLALFHPSLLSTLVYRFGPPGTEAAHVDQVQSNGQFGLYRHEALMRCGGFAPTRDSICEDVTLARHLFLSGYEVGFHEGEALAETEMYSSGIECLINWPRSLSLRDRILPYSGFLGLANIVFLQVIPILVVVWRPEMVRSQPGIGALNRFLLATRLGLLVGMRRAYSQTRWTYWLSPLADPISLVAYLIHLSKRQHSWRGQQLVAESE